MRQVLHVSCSAIDRPGVYPTIGDALEAVVDGALISIAAGRYEERLSITKPVTLAAADGAAGAVELHASGGSVIVSRAEALQLSGLAIAGAAGESAVIDIRHGQVTLDGCRVNGPAWAGVFAQGNSTVVLRGCSIGNARGGGVVVTASGNSTIEACTLAGAGSSSVVVGAQGRLVIRDSHIEGPSGNGICVTGRGQVTIEDVTIKSSAGQAIAIEQEASATLRRVIVGGGADIDVFLASSGAIELADCVFTGAAGHSVHVDGAAPVLRGCTLSGAATGGLYATGGARPEMDDCEIDCAGLGVVADAGSQVTLTGVRVSGEQGFGLAVSGGALISAIRAVLTGVGAVVGADGTLRASGCEITGAPQDGVQVLGGTAALAGCRISEARRHGVLVADDGTAEIECSAIVGNGGDGVRAEAASPVRLRDCDVRDNGGAAVSNPRGPNPPLAAVDGPASRSPSPDLAVAPSAERIATLIGLAEARKALTEKLTKIGVLVARGEPVTETHNLVFVGAGGMGRRAVAALYARSLAELGVLTVGDLRAVPLSRVPAHWAGQAGRWLGWLLAETAGGALLLDANKEFWTYPEAVRAEIFGAIPGALGVAGTVLLLSGPLGELLPVLDSDDALAGCFAGSVTFAGYGAEQLAALTVRRLEARGHDIAADVLPALVATFATTSGAGAWHAHRFADLISETAAAREVTAAAARSAFSGTA
jgi:hypothetical protein